MNHKMLNEEEFDTEPDYLFVVKSKRADFLLAQLKEINVRVKEFPSAKNKENTNIIIYFSDDVLDQMAEINRLKCRLLDQNVSTYFKNHAEELFEQFQARQKQFLMLKVLDQEIDIDQ